MTATKRPNPVWVSLPKDSDDEPARGIYDGDSYLVRLAGGSVVWAVFVRDHGTHFERIAPDSDESTGEVLDDVETVLVSGYSTETIAALLSYAKEVT